MNAANLIPFPSEYTRLKEAYDIAHQQTLTSWQNEVKTADALYKSNSWKHLASNWDTYCSEALGLMPYRASTYRAMKVEIPTFLLIQSAAENSTPSAYECRQLRERLDRVCQDATLRSETYIRCFEETGEILPSEGQLEAVYSVMLRRKIDNVVSINGMDIDVSDATKEAIAQELYELKMRKLEHIGRNAKKKPPVIVTSAVLEVLKQGSLPDRELPALGELIEISWWKAKEASES